VGLNRARNPTTVLLLKLDQQMKGTIPTPPIRIEVTIQGKYIAGIELFGEIDQAGISKVGG
jgi:hypothetical protein